MTWIKVADEKPPMDVPLFVIIQEWGQPGNLAIARAFQSILPDQPIKWMLDRNVYQLECPYYIADTVRYWARQEEMPEDIKKRELMQISCME